MKINQFDVRKGNKVETVLVVPFNVQANINEIAEKHLAEGADEVIVTVWELGKKIDVQSFVNEVEVTLAQVEEIVTVEGVAKAVAVEAVTEVIESEAKLNMLKDSKGVFSWVCEPRYGEMNCMLVSGKRPVRRKVKTDEFGQYIEEKKIKYYL